ncbi:MAG TPA: SDR family oxidoreductase [Candidatus Limnocylindria bacterium]|nr:SDR family oxidoreductase [Candidatus Limnocylindria bacterium]
MLQLTEGDYGRVVAVSTPFAQQPGATNAAYAASKAALEALILSVAREGREHGLTANVVVVRSIPSESPADGNASRPRTWTRPEELSSTMLWLCSDEAGLVTAHGFRSTAAREQITSPKGAVETLAHTIGDFRRQGLLTTDHHRVVIQNAERLLALTEGGGE